MTAADSADVPEPPAADPLLLPLRATGTRPPLFLVAAQGVNALGYTAVARLLPADQPVYVVQPKKRRPRFPAEGIRADGRDAYPLVAAWYVAAIRTVAPHGPYQLAGMCDGALIAFRMAVQLEAAGERVGVLAVLDTWPLENTSVYPLVLLKIRARNWVERDDEQRRRLLRRKAQEVVERGERLLRPSPPAPRTAAQALRRVRWRAKLWPGPGFRPPVIEAPIAVLRVHEQPYWRIRDLALGWRDRTKGVVTVHILPGKHESWMKAPHVASLARTLGAYLEPAPPATPERVLRRRAARAEVAVEEAGDPGAVAAAPVEAEAVRRTGESALAWRIRSAVGRGRAALRVLLEKAAGGDELE
jgi:thioesterase domain-containing protein